MAAELNRPFLAFHFFQETPKMPVNLSAPRAQDLLPVAGLRIGVAEAGVRKANRKDLTVMLLEPGSSVGGVFTKNRFCAAPVQPAQPASVYLGDGRGRRRIISPAPPLRRHRTRRAERGRNASCVGVYPRHAPPRTAATAQRLRRED